MNDKHSPAGLAKSSTGIAGFDYLTGGGLPLERTALVLGGTGTGKTVFSLQTLVAGARQGEPGIFVTFSEPPQQVMQNGSGFGWNLEEFEHGKLIFLDAQMRPSIVRAGHFDLTGMLAGLRSVATEMGARRIVFDGLDVLLTLLDDRMSELQEVFRLRDWLLENRFTALITANIEGRGASMVDRWNLIQSIADCAVALDMVVHDGRSGRRLRVVKYRGSPCVEDEVAFNIGSTGIEVHVPITALTEPVSVIPAALQPEIAQARAELNQRIAEIDRFFEMKQAELDFLRKKQQPSSTERVPRPSTAKRAARVG